MNLGYQFNFQSSIISLSKLLVREKGDTKDSKGVYLICPSKTEPEMYELVCRSMEERRQWISILRNAIFKRSREGKHTPFAVLYWSLQLCFIN